MENFVKNISTYIYGGYVPCVDVVFTFDTIAGDLDTRTIDAIIDEYL